MKAIYACKLYKASNRKSKIEAAIADPLNLELVTQLKSYLDEEYQDVIDRQEAKDRADRLETFIDNGLDDNGSTPSTDHESAPAPSAGVGGPSGSRPSLSEKFDMLLSEGQQSTDVTDEPVDGNIDESIADVDESTQPSDLEEIEESTAIEGIEQINPSDGGTNTLDLCGDIKNLLSSDELTKGVNRALVKKNELWVHYNDDINLNTVMGPVIEKLNSSTYHDLNFNRLARSENAIVFQIDSSDMNTEVADGI